VVNTPTDLGCQRRLVNLPELQAKARAANRRLLKVQRAGQGCAIETTLWERISQPSVEEGQKNRALRFGDPRVMALTGALCVALTATVGFTNKSLRALVTSLLGAPYGPAQMTYDLRRLRLKGLVARVPHTHAYTLTPDGLKAAVFTPSSSAGSCTLCSPPTSPQHLHRYAPRWPPSTARVPITSTKPGLPLPPEKLLHL
jgi:hypothetical protein